MTSVVGSPRKMERLEKNMRHTLENSRVKGNSMRESKEY